MNTDTGASCPTEPSAPPRTPRERTGKILALCILAAGALVVAVLVHTRPEVSQMPPPPMEARVEWMSAEPAGTMARIEAQGVVMPAREVVVMSRVTGEVIAMHPHFEPGGRIAAGEVMVRLDPNDYEFTLSDREAALIQAEADLRIERGQSEIASNEWARAAGPGPAPELALRAPHLARAEAAMQAAAAARDLARENVERTAVRTPFHAVVMERSVNLGSQVTPQAVLAKIAGSDEYWAEISLPFDRLNALPAADGDGALPPLPVRVFYGSVPHERPGELLRVDPRIEASGRTARLIVRIPRPLEAHGDAPGLMLGSYVRCVMDGALPDGTAGVRIPRTALREGDAVWMVDDEMRLEIRHVTVLWREPDTVVVGPEVRAGERVVTSTIPNPIPGLPLRPLSDEAESKPAEPGS
ncbi:MAG: efflux RND transporter periplasmic adaptor subunit [Kiritimatiellae bacterium]|nr:efflux RND transporter periplasmic adaptor subunit [Kiritimatiellia bacterium]